MKMHLALTAIGFHNQANHSKYLGIANAETAGDFQFLSGQPHLGQIVIERDAKIADPPQQVGNGGWTLYVWAISLFVCALLTASNTLSAFSEQQDASVSRHAGRVYPVQRTWCFGCRPCFLGPGSPCQEQLFWKV